MICKEHSWKKNGHSRGKQRYICKRCNKTSYEVNPNGIKKLLNFILDFINNYSDNNEFIWEEVIDRDESGQIIDTFNAYSYKISKMTVSWKEFKRQVDKMETFSQPIAIFMCEPDLESLDWKEKRLIAYEVYK